MPVSAMAAASDYVKRGWSVIPLRPGTKLPAIRWEPYQHHRAGEAELARWFERWPSITIGGVTGGISGLVVLDVDLGHGGCDSLAALERLHGPLPDTVEAETGGGRRHLYFALPPLALHNKAGLAAGIDLRGEGGMVVAPPSLYPSGKPYRWRPGHEPAALPLALMLHWLQLLAGEAPAGRGHPLAHWRAQVRARVEEGRRNTTVASFAGHLLWHGVDADVLAELLLCWNRMRCRPPLEDGEVARVAASVAERHDRGAAPEPGTPGD
jgi:Bifunctional DNA primase/polymerase, N-terminal/Primase C terminal 1 (PriCT-1)